MAQEEVNYSELICFVLSGATECLCMSLDPSKVVRRLISTHHLTDDDKREINQFARMDEKVEKLLEILKLHDKEAYDDFMKALKDFHPDLYKDVYDYELRYHAGERPRKRPNSSQGQPSDNPESQGGDASKGTRKEQEGKQQSSAAGGTHQHNTFNMGSMFKNTSNTTSNNYRYNQINVIGNCVNIDGDQTNVGGNVYNVDGNVTVIGGKIYPMPGKPKPFKQYGKSQNYNFTSQPGGPKPKYTYTTYTSTHYETDTDPFPKQKPKTDPKPDP